MTCLDRLKIDYPDKVIEDCNHDRIGCPHQYGYLATPDYCGTDEYPSMIARCTACWIRELPDDVPEDLIGVPDIKPRILDSGNRREFESGAVRDIQEGKGRCDLLPLDVVAEYLTLNGKPNPVLSNIYMFQENNDYEHLIRAIDEFNEFRWHNNKTMLLEVAIHFEEGAKKYGDNNWRKGIPVRCYIDSGVRHYLKFLRGDKDEPHDRAFCWNMMCAIWTCKHHPELNDYSKENE